MLILDPCGWCQVHTAGSRPALSGCTAPCLRRIPTASFVRGRTEARAPGESRRTLRGDAAAAAGGFDSSPGGGAGLGDGTGFGDFSKGLRAFILARMNGVAHYHLLDLNAKGTSRTFRFGMNGPGELQYRAGDITLISGPSAFATSVPFLFSIVHEPTGDAEMRVNGSFEKSTKMPLPSNGVHGENYIGFHDMSDSAPSASGWYGAIIMYNRAIGLLRPKNERKSSPIWQRSGNAVETRLGSPQYRPGE